MSDFIESFIGVFRSFQEELRGKGMYSDAYCADGKVTGPEIVLDKNMGQALSFTSLGYLGISECPEMREAVMANAKFYALGSTSSRTVMDYNTHRCLEIALADFKRSETCLLLNTGYAASSYLMEVLISEFRAGYDRLPNKPKSMVFVDGLTHISMLEALVHIKRRDKAYVKKYEHLNYEMLEDELKKTVDFTGARFIVSDSIFSMNGSCADLRKMLELAKQYEAFIVLDNAHSDGCYGNEGRGLAEMHGITSEEDLRYFFQAGTMSKAFGLLGGYVTLPYCISDLARVSCLPYVFSVAQSPFEAANALYALSLIRSRIGEQKRRILAENTEMVHKNLNSMNFNTLNSNSHIIPVVIGEETKCLAVQKYLLEKHRILIGAVRFPAVKEGEALLRLSITAMHNEEHIQRLLTALLGAREKFDF